MKVILFPSSVEPVGVATHVLNLACLLKDAGVLDTIMCPQEGWLCNQLRAEDLPYHVLNISYRPTEFLRSNWVVFSFLKSRKNPKVVHLHGRFPLFASLLSMFLLKNTRFVVTIHQFRDTGNSGFLGWKNKLEAFCLRYLVEKICCVSNALRLDVVRWLGSKYSKKVILIRNWISSENTGLTSSARVMHKKEAKIRIVAVGRLAPEKDFGLLIDAVQMLRSQGNPVFCDIIGDGPEREKLLLQIQRLKLDDCVQLRGWLPDARKRLDQYDLLVVPSRRESFGLVVLEAYEAGVPVVVSDVPGLNEIVRDRETGLLFEAGSAESLAQRIFEVIKDPHLANFLVQRGKEFVKSYLPSSELLKKYISFYGLQEDEKR